MEAHQVLSNLKFHSFYILFANFIYLTDVQIQHFTVVNVQEAQTTF